MTERHYYDSLDQKVNHLTLQRPESLYNGEGQHADAHYYQSQQQLPHQEWEQRSNDRYSERPMTNAVKQNLWGGNQDTQNWDQQQRKLTYGEELRA